MIQVAIVDDNQHDMKKLHSYLNQWQFTNEVDFQIELFDNVKTFLSSFITKVYDIVFLDIEMPIIDGIQLSKKLYHLNSKSKVAFITTHIDRAVDGYGQNVVAFFIKDNWEECILRIDTLLREMFVDSNYLIKTSTGEMLCKKTDISLITIEERKVVMYLYTSDKHVITGKTLEQFVYEMNVDYLFQINRSCYINFNHLKKLQFDAIWVNGVAFSIDIPRRKRLSVRNSFYSFLEKRKIQ
ncbi:MAG: response regulator transcription factor [Bacilli bacterium]|nr:response regulator transcription factor [Bacilli bacterium]